MRVIGLTGGIATGKSTVSNYLLSLDIPVIDADVLSREVVEPGSEGLEKLVQTFGSDLLTPDGQLNRPVLAQKLFHNDAIRKQVNQLLHPLIYAAMFEKVQQYRSNNEDLVVLDIPLLFETIDPEKFDAIWLVYIPEPLQLERLKKRDQLTQEAAQARIASQLSIEEKKRLADVVIHNSGSIEDTQKQIQALLKLDGNDANSLDNITF